MASDNKSTKGSASKTPAGVPEGWIEDVRSLPLYNVRDCKGGVKGYLVDAQILNGSGSGGDSDGAKAFGALVLKLTEPCQAILNGDLVTVEAGKEVFVHGAALADLVNIALDQKTVREYVLRPIVGEDGRNKETKTAAGYKMPLWERFHNPKTFERATVTSRIPAMTPPVFLNTLEVAKIHGVTAAMAQVGSGGNGIPALDTGFNPKQLES